jgi:hypothetical protein
MYILAQICLVKVYQSFDSHQNSRTSQYDPSNDNRHVWTEATRERHVRLEPAGQARKVGREPGKQCGSCGEWLWAEWRTHTVGMYSLTTLESQVAEAAMC